MAEASISVDQDQFSCPVCLDLLKDPVTIHCGHSYCLVCINGCWDQEDQRRIYSCPQCRETFTPRPVLRRNNMLAEVVEKLKKTQLQAASPAHCYAGAGDVECDFCTGRKLKAIKSCLVCLASYCETHVQSHYQSPVFKKHKLVKTSKQLQQMICSQHDKLIEIYCRTDQSFICYLCTMHDHKGHDTVAAAAERSEKQNQLKQMQIKSKQRLQEKEKTLQELRKAVNSIKSAVEDSERIFTELISSIEKKRSEVTKLIRDQEKAELSQTEELVEKLEQEITDLKRRNTELEQLLHTEDHIHFLQSFQTLSVSSGSEDSSSITVHQHLSFDGVMKSLSDLKDRIEDFCKEDFSKISAQGGFSIWAITPEERWENDKQFDSLTPTLGYMSGHQARKFFLQSGLPSSVLAEIWDLADLGRDGRMDRLEFSIAMKLIKLQLQGQPLPVSLPVIMKQTPVPTLTSSARFAAEVQMIFPSEPKTREDFLHYYCQLTLDPKTVNHKLRLSENNRVVLRRIGGQCYSDHPERFDYFLQVLCKESVSGRCYWEVEWSKSVYISVSYKTISRKGRGNECVFGYNNQSWSLFCSSSSSLCFYHNNIKTKISAPSSSRIGVYVDHSAGTLSFYSISDTMTLIHTVHTTFTQPLYAGFWVGGTVRLTNL